MAPAESRSQISADIFPDKGDLFQKCDDQDADEICQGNAKSLVYHIPDAQVQILLLIVHDDGVDQVYAQTIGCQLRQRLLEPLGQELLPVHIFQEHEHRGSKGHSVEHLVALEICVGSMGFRRHHISIYEAEGDGGDTQQIDPDPLLFAEFGIVQQPAQQEVKDQIVHLDLEKALP